jgi:hypothetical protein
MVFHAHHPINFYGPTRWTINLDRPLPPRQSEEAMTDIIFRAFQLAREGCYQNIRHLEVALAKEGYDQAQLHLSGSLIRKQLYAILRKKE